jgi:hypothetical protein
MCRRLESMAMSPHIHIHTRHPRGYCTETRVGLDGYVSTCMLGCEKCYTTDYCMLLTTNATYKMRGVDELRYANKTRCGCPQWWCKYVSGRRRVGWGRGRGRGVSVTVTGGKSKTRGHKGERERNTTLRKFLLPTKRSRCKRQTGKGSRESAI